MKKQKYRLNSDKLFRNFVVMSTVITTGVLIVKIANCGLAWMSTIRIFWIERRKEI